MVLTSNATLAALSAEAAQRSHAPNGVVEVSYFELSTLILSLAVVIMVSHKLQMKIERQFTVAAIRCFIQLSALGLILVPIIVWNRPLLVLAYILLMIFIAAVEASSRPPYVFDSLFIVCFISIFVTVSIFGVFTFAVVLRTGLEAQYAIPIIGMIAGSSMTAVSVAISNVVNCIVNRKESIEILLVLGASRWEAALDTVRSTVLLALTPTLNLLAVTGLVSIPGMMTGQIIGGTPPSLAAKYQLVILYVAAGAATIATVLASILTIDVLIDDEYRIRSEKLVPREHVSRLDALFTSAKHLGRLFMMWRHRSMEQRSPFPPHVYDEPPASPKTSDLLTSRTNTRTSYGSSSMNTEENVAH